MRELRTKIFLGLLVGFMCVQGCGVANIDSPISKRNALIKMSSYVFLEPSNSTQKIVYLQLKNLTNHAAFDVAQDLQALLESKGFTITQQPELAYYLLQVNVLRSGSTTPQAVEDALNRGFGATCNEAQAMGPDRIYSVIADVQVSERISAAQQIKEKRKTLKKLPQKNEAMEFSATTKTQWKRYQTRIIGTIPHTRLPVLRSALTHTISEIF
jgi:hypothetical protein